MRRGFTLLEALVSLALSLAGATIRIVEFAGNVARAADCQVATSMLAEIARAEGDFRSNDPDGNGLNDFWTADVLGLHARIPAGGARPIELVSDRVAGADSSIWGFALAREFRVRFRPMRPSADSSSSITGTGQSCLDAASVFPASPEAHGCSKGG